MTCSLHRSSGRDARTSALIISGQCGEMEQCGPNLRRQHMFVATLLVCKYLRRYHLSCYYGSAMLLIASHETPGRLHEDHWLCNSDCEESRYIGYLVQATNDNKSRVHNFDGDSVVASLAKSDVVKSRFLSCDSGCRKCGRPPRSSQSLICFAIELGRTDPSFGASETTFLSSLHPATERHHLFKRLCSPASSIVYCVGATPPLVCAISCDAPKTASKP